MSEQPERRRRFRRAEDRERERALQHRPSQRVKQAAVGLLALVAVILAIAVAALGIGAINDRHALDRATRALHSARAALRQTVETRQLAAAIQLSRYRTVLEDCQAQNARHELTVARLKRGYAVALAHTGSGAQRRELRESESFSVSLISAIAPRQDCTALAAHDAPGT